jgi:hypothetical protein
VVDSECSSLGIGKVVIIPREGSDRSANISYSAKMRTWVGESSYDQQIIDWRRNRYLYHRRKQGIRTTVGNASSEHGDARVPDMFL